MEHIKYHPWILEGFDEVPYNFLEPRPILTELDAEVVSELLTYGFDQAELEQVLLKNEQVPVLNFYHLMVERRRQDMETADFDSSGSITDRRMSNDPMVTRFENDEVVPVSSVEKKLHRQIMQRQSTKNLLLSRSGGSSKQNSNPLLLSKSGTSSKESSTPLSDQVTPMVE